MPLYESPAVALRSRRLGEADKIVTFFTLRFGKIRAVAKGAFKPKSRFGGRLEPFVHSNVIAFGKEKADLLRLNSCDVLTHFSALRDDFARLNRAFVAAELLDVCQKERDVNEEGYALALAFLKTLAQETHPDRQDMLLRLFEIKYLAQIGFRPSLSRCVICRKPATGTRLGFNAARGGVVCAPCLAGDPWAVAAPAGAVRLLERGLDTPLERAGRLTAAGGLMASVERLVGEMVKAHVSRELRSERFIRL
ncbi:MAG: DNA repair protein RecO [Nitrospinae bacterium]|nr:DNA repair protein RecO [Nitrospinota bacterium]